MNPSRFLVYFFQCFHQMQISSPLKNYDRFWFRAWQKIYRFSRKRISFCILLELAYKTLFVHWYLFTFLNGVAHFVSFIFTAFVPSSCRIFFLYYFGQTFSLSFPLHKISMLISFLFLLIIKIRPLQWWFSLSKYFFVLDW